jgi:uncharacterized protein DUF4160
VPTVLRWGPVRAFFYSNEGGEPAHVHVRADGKEAKFGFMIFRLPPMRDFRRTNSVVSFAI